MSKTRDNYQVQGQTLDEVKRSLNFLLQRMADRLDRAEGIRGEPTIEAPLNMMDNPVNDVGEGEDNPDAARLDDLQFFPSVAENETVTGAWTFEGLLTVDEMNARTIRVYDDSGNLIHSFE